MLKRILFGIAWGATAGGALGAFNGSLDHAIGFAFLGITAFMWVVYIDIIERNSR